MATCKTCRDRASVTGFRAARAASTAMAAASDPVVILSAARTPLGRFMGELSPFSAHKLGSHVIGAALERAKLLPERIDEVFMGNVLPAGQGQAPARQAARGARLPDATGATTINKVCGSGMKATMLAHDIINAGSAEIVLSGGISAAPELFLPPIERRFDARLYATELRPKPDIRFAELGPYAGAVGAALLTVEE